MAPGEAPSQSSKTLPPSRVLSPQDFGKSASRRAQSRSRVELTAPKRSRSRSRTLPKVTSTLESGPPAQEGLPVPSSVRVAAWCSAIGPTSPAQITDFAPTTTAQSTRRLSSDTFGRRDSASEGSPYPSRRLEDEGSLEMRQSRSASTYESDHERYGLPCEQRSAAADDNVGETTPATPQTAAWRKEADEEWEARFERKFRPPSQHLSPRASLLDTANVVYEKGSSPKGTTDGHTSSVHLFKLHNPFSDRTTTKEMKVTGSTGVASSSSSYFPSHDHWRRSLPQNSDSGPMQSETWNAWKNLGERHRASIGGSSRGHHDAADSTTSRNNSMASSTSSSSRLPLTHRASSHNFLAGIIGLEPSSQSASSAEASGPASGPSIHKADLKHLLRRSGKLTRPPSTEGLISQGKHSATERCEGKGSPLKTAFPLPQDSSRTAVAQEVPARAQRRMSMPSRQGQNLSVVSNGMVTSFGAENADFGVSTSRRDRATSVNRYPSGLSLSSSVAHPMTFGGAGDTVSQPSRNPVYRIEESQAASEKCPVDALSPMEANCGSQQGDSVVQHRTQKSCRSPVFGNGLAPRSNGNTSNHRPRSRSEAEVPRSDALPSTYILNSPSVLRRVFVPPVQMDPHDEEQHTGSEASADEGAGEPEQAVGNNAHKPLQEHRKRVDQTLPTLAPPGSVAQTELALPAPVMTPSHSAFREKEEATVMSRSSSSKSSRTMASAGALLSPTKLLRRLASRDGLSSTSRGQSSSLDASHGGSYSSSKPALISKPDDKPTPNRSPAASTSPSHSVQTKRGMPLARPKTAPAEPETTSRSRRPSLVWTGHSTPVLHSDTAQQSIADTTTSPDKVPAEPKSSTGSGASQRPEDAPSSLGLYMMPSHRSNILGDVPAMDSSSSSDGASLNCSPYSVASNNLPFPFSSTETRMVHPAPTAEVGASKEGEAGASLLYRPPTQSLYQRRRSATLPAAPSVGSTKPLSLVLDPTRKEAEEANTGLTGLYINDLPLGVDAPLRPSSGVRPASPSPNSAMYYPSSLQDASPVSSPSRPGFRASTPPRPPRRNVAGGRPLSYFGLAAAAPSDQPTMTPPSPATQGSVILGPAAAKSLHGWEHQGQVSGRGANRSASPGRNPSTARARIEKFFGGGMGTGKANAHKGTVAP